jgi:hypothetical protein
MVPSCGVPQVELQRMMKRNSDAIAEMTAQQGRNNDRASDHRVSGLSAAKELLGFRLADPAVDVRGWSVQAADERHAGIVSGLLVDIHTRRVRYLAVALDVALDRRARSRDPGTVMIPVGMARRADDARTVLLDGITSSMMIRAPRIPARAIMRADEDATLAVYGLPSSGISERDMYASAHFDDSRLLKSAW